SVCVSSARSTEQEYGAGGDFPHRRRKAASASEASQAASAREATATTQPRAPPPAPMSAAAATAARTAARPLKSRPSACRCTRAAYVEPLLGQRLALHRQVRDGRGNARKRPIQSRRPRGVAQLAEHRSP